jgi:isoleucyl-tRNA synthetase
VHIAPDHGEDDFDLCKQHGISPVFAVENDGKYREDWPWVGGEPLSVINSKLNAPPNSDGTGGRICEDLKKAGALLSARNDESTKHSYPHSWRSKAKVIFRCTPQWFIPMDAPHPSPLPAGERGQTLRDIALQAIKDTRWVPAKGENRIRAMVEGRPDWVISRQRAWGVPITLFVHKKSGVYLNDPAVNARIIAGIKMHGVDAWNEEDAQGYLGDAYKLDDYERVTDILDVWFDSGCTHAFVLESGRWPDLAAPADLYLEGSDQHRGWFQSSLLESCGTRGRAPYKAVLTHGFTMDQKGLKMSKSLGNTVDPIALMKESGADIIRLWALSVDYTEDHRIGKEVLAGVSDQYRKLRNTFRYMLGALAGFEEAEKIAVADMPELERYVLHLLSDMDAKLRAAVNDYDFNSYVRLLSDFANNDLSAFFFDIRKDCLYCDAPANPKRRAYRTALDILFHALVRYAAPVLVFTAEEVWQTRYPSEDGSVHFLEWPNLAQSLRHPGESRGPDTGDAGKVDPGLRRDDEFLAKWERLRRVRLSITAAIEPLRRDKIVGSSLEAEVKVYGADKALINFLESADVAELAIIASLKISESPLPAGLNQGDLFGFGFHVQRTHNHKCGRCWRHLPDVTEDGALCFRCDEVTA